MELEKFLGHLQGVKRSGRRIMALCPAHDDHNPSLSVCEKDGRILVHCHAGCKGTDVVAAIGLTFEDLFIESYSDRAKPRIEREYPYLDEEGRERYRVLRYSDKSFRVGRFEDGEWVSGIGNERRVLYRLPEVLAAPRDTTIYVVEGEKDVDALWKRGFIATCNPFGAGKFSIDFAASLSGRQIVCVADRDDPGYKHAALVREILTPVAASFRSVEAKIGKDASDHFDSGLGVGDFIPVSSVSEDVAESLQKANKGKSYDLQLVGDLIDAPAEEHQWLVDGLLSASGTSLITAKPKVGKSTLLRYLAFCVARGEPFLGRETRKGSVIYLAIEEKRGEVVARFSEMGCGHDDKIFIHVGTAPAQAIQELGPLIDEIRPALVIVDPMFKWVRVADASDYAKVSAALEPVIDLARSSGAHFALAHHSGKGEREDGDSVLGSTAIFGAVDTLLMLRKSGEQRTAKSTNRYGQDLEECVISLDKGTSVVTLQGTLDALKIGLMLTAIAEELKQNPELTEKELKDRIGGNTGFVGKALRSGCEDGRFLKTGAGVRGNPYLYSLSQDFLFSGLPNIDKRENEKARIIDEEV